MPNEPGPIPHGTPRRARAILLIAALAAGGVPASPACAAGRLLATGGVTQIEGAAGGGLVPWAVLTGYGTAGQNGATAFITSVDTGDYRLQAGGVAFTWNNRVELSLARQDLDLGSIGAALSLPPGAVVGQNIFGAKVRVLGNIVYGRWPQVAVGAQYKQVHDFDIPEFLGARDDEDTDYYLSIGRLFLAGLAGRNVYLNATVRWTRANELGLLGFGSADEHDYEAMFEGAAAIFLDRRTAIGIEYRQKPDNLDLGEDDWADAFIAWFPSKHLALTIAYARLGTVATVENQRGLYLSAQATF